MGFYRHGVGVHIDIERVFTVGAAYAFEAVFIALVENLNNAFVVFARQLESQPVVFDPLAPQVLRLGFRLGPGRLFVPHELVAFGAVKRKSVLQQGAGVGKALSGALHIQIEDGEWPTDVAVLQLHAQLGARIRELVNIGLYQEELLWIERLEVLIKDLAGQGFVQRHGFVVVAGKNFRRDMRGPGFLGVRRQ